MFLTLHSDFESRNPDEAEYAQAVEANRRAAHEAAHGTLDGYVPLREFPCPGSIRVIPDLSDEHYVVAACDACQWTSTVKRESVRQMWAAPEPTESSTPF